MAVARRLDILLYSKENKIGSDERYGQNYYRRKGRFNEVDFVKR